MSWFEPPDDFEGEGYEEDIKYAISVDGTVDFVVGPGGDIEIVGGRKGDPIEQKRANAIQQIILRILTPLGTVRDQDGNPTYYGSYLTTLIGEKQTELTNMIFRAYVMWCLSDFEYFGEGGEWFFVDAFVFFDGLEVLELLVVHFPFFGGSSLVAASSAGPASAVPAAAPIGNAIQWLIRRCIIESSTSLATVRPVIGFEL